MCKFVSRSDLRYPNYKPKQSKTCLKWPNPRWPPVRGSPRKKIWQFTAPWVQEPVCKFLSRSDLWYPNYKPKHHSHVGCSASAASLVVVVVCDKAIHRASRWELKMTTPNATNHFKNCDWSKFRGACSLIKRYINICPSGQNHLTRFLELSEVEFVDESKRSEWYLLGCDDGLTTLKTPPNMI